MLIQEVKIEDSLSFLARDKGIFAALPPNSLHADLLFTGLC